MMGPHTLFVFGDSYADTGNCKKSFTIPRKLPYGITFPGTPTVRFSDGRVWTDYIASYLDVRSPIPYKFMKIHQNHIFDMNGNDTKNLLALTTLLIDQLATNLERIHSLAVRKIAVTAIEPMGCLPVATASFSYKNCSKAGNFNSKFHNEILAKAVKKCNEQRKRTNKSAFVMLNLYKAFLFAMKKHRKHTGSLKVKMNPLEPCCVGSCGSVEKSGAKLYNVCKKPEASFFWDSVHLSQKGWHAVYSALRSSLHKLIRI
ncbi:hypothetical protein SLA2020_243790 [Shorea laevis]